MSITFTEVRTIEATPERVYAVLTDLAGYAAWNPWIVRAAGEVREGAVISVDVVLKGKAQTYNHRILKTRPGEEFVWCDMGWFTVLAYGYRQRLLSPWGNGGCRYEVNLPISGPLAGLVNAQYGSTLRDGLRREADALKAHCEGAGRTVS